MANDDETPDPEESSPDDDDEGRAQTKDDDSKKSGMSPDKRRLFIGIGALVLVVIAIIAVVWWLHARKYESTDDAYIDTHIVHLSPQISGRVLKVFVQDNMRVHAGQLLVEIDPAQVGASDKQAASKVAQATAQLAQAHADLLVKQAGLDQARATAAGAAAQAANASSDLARYRGLAREMPAAIARQQLDQTHANAIHAAAQRKSADEQVAAAVAQIGVAQAQIAAAQAAVGTAKAQANQARLNFGYARIVAPVDGTIADSNLAVGNSVTPSTEMLAIVPLKVWVTADFKETQLDEIRVGQKVDIEVDAYSDKNFHGHVDSIQRGAGQAFALLPAQNATGNFIKVVQRVPVKIVFDRLPAENKYVLGPGMSVSPRVHVR